MPGRPRRARWCHTCEETRPVEAFRPRAMQCRRCTNRGWFPPQQLASDPPREAPASALPVPLAWPLTRYQRRQVSDAAGHRCAICGQASSRLSVDHDHRTGNARGMLCTHCNLGLGSFRDDPAVLRRAIRYLDAPPVRGYLNGRLVVDGPLRPRLRETHAGEQSSASEV